MSSVHVAAKLSGYESVGLSVVLCVLLCKGHGNVSHIAISMFP